MLAVCVFRTMRVAAMGSHNTIISSLPDFAKGILSRVRGDIIFASECLDEEMPVKDME